MTQILITAVFAVALAADWKPRLHREPKRVWITYGVLMAISWLVLILYSLDVNVPSPFLPLQKLLNGLFGL